ncbi:MAG TPA: hypothetical protein PKL31_10000 [Fulvivirga sp.]|nr:hypothetical protein [Fulvivirga sp.]
MNKEIKDQYLSVKKLVENELITVFDKRIDNHKKRLESGKKELEGIAVNDVKLPETLAKSAQYKEKLLALTNQLNGAAFEDFDTEFNSFLTSVEQYLLTVENGKKRVQDAERFTIQPGDGLKTKIFKPFKKLGYSVSKWPEKLSNGVRKVRGKEKKPLKPWYHIIQLQDLTRYYLKEDFIRQLKPSIDTYYKAITTTSLNLWAVDEQLDKQLWVHFREEEVVEFSTLPIEEALKMLDEAKLTISKLVLEAFETSSKKFETQYVKVGTFEYSNTRISAAKSQRLHQSFLRGFTSFNKNWKNTLISLTDDWEIDLELYRLIFTSIYEYHQVKSEVKHRIEKLIFKKLEEISDFIEEWRNKLGEVKNDKQLKALLVEHLPKISHDIRHLVDDSSEFVISQDLPELINNVVAVTSDEIERVSTRRAVVKGISFTEPVKSSQINYISPFELINFESAPQFNKVTKEVKISVTFHISEAQNILMQLAEIATFNLESAISAIVEEGGQEGNRIAQEGLDRTSEKIERVKNSLLKIDEVLTENLLSGLKVFSNSLIQFTNNENILELRVRIARGKALERSRQLKNRAVEIVRNFLPLAISFIKTNYLKLEKLIRSNLKKLGIRKSKESITTELADFLAETEQSINNLPFVYQRLFRAAPLEETNFFEGRMVEINQLNKAYNQWMQGRFATVLVVGEKGAGITTLFNLYLKELGNSCPVVRVVPSSNINFEADLFRTFEKAFDFSIKSFEDLVEGLNKGEKQIIVLENLQKLYLKKMGGFHSVKLVTELISLTSKNIFWLIGCTEYAFNYLNKTIQLSEHFSYRVSLEDLTNEDIINVIERRHRVSGYNLEFEPSNEDLNSKKFKKMSATEQHEYLKKNYFNDLNKVAKSNISLALIYWLRSTKQATNHTILITSLKDIDFSFMKGLSFEKLNVLNMLLLNDGLTENEVAEVTGQGVQKNRSVLYPLFEDGIIVRHGDTYLINPLLYRQTVTLLKTKNILH